MLDESTYRCIKKEYGFPAYIFDSDRFCENYRLLTEGGSEELLSAYRQELTGCKDLHDQVVTRMNIARCLLDLGRGDEARSHLEFVAQNGGKLAIRAEASARLAALSPAGTAAGLTGALGTKPSVSWNCT